MNIVETVLCVKNNMRLPMSLMSISIGNVEYGNHYADKFI